MYTKALILTFVCQDAPCFPMIHVLKIIRINGYLTLVTTVLQMDGNVHWLDGLPQRCSPL